MGRTSVSEVAARCIEILVAGPSDDRFLFVLAGPAARQVLEGREGGIAGRWPRVWALRGLLYAWDDKATAAVVRAADDGSWRVREMAAKVMAAHGVEGTLRALNRLAEDPVARVRSAAVRALQKTDRS